jgi:hypothetical protein
VHLAVALLHAEEASDDQVGDQLAVGGDALGGGHAA